MYKECVIKESRSFEKCPRCKMVLEIVRYECHICSGTGLINWIDAMFRKENNE